MSQRRSALVFPGQGSQQVGMGKDLCAFSPAARAVFEQADQILGFPLSEICFQGPEEALNDTINTQPAVMTTSVAALRALEDRLEPPAFVAGHSLGEFSALVAAGALPFEEALLLVRERGRLMKEAGERSPGGMAAIIGLETADVERICGRAQESTGGHLGVANDNSPGQVVVSGDLVTLQVGMKEMKQAGAKRVIQLAVSIAAHSPLMSKAAVVFQRALQETTFRPLQAPLVANATAGPVTDPDQLCDVLSRQLTSPVHWTDSVRWMIEQGVTHFDEIGPGEVLTGLLRRIDGSVERRATAQILTGES